MITSDQAELYLDTLATVRVTRWWADKAGVEEIEVTGDVCRVTEKALLLDYEGDDLWIPLSQIESITADGMGFRSVPPVSQAAPMPLDTALRMARMFNARLAVRNGRLGYVANGDAIPRQAQESIRLHTEVLTWLLMPDASRTAQAAADPYNVLGVPPAAAPETIKTAYQRLIRKMHPDVNPCVVDADLCELLNKRAAAINVAYETAMRRAGAHT